MEHISGLTAGMNLDFTKTKLPANKTRIAKNIRIFTSGLDSSQSVCNVDGNTFSFRVPTTSNVLKITVPAFPVAVSFILNGISLGPINVNSTTGYSDISTLINSNTSLQALGITSSYSDTQVLVYSLLNAGNQTITTNIFSATPVGVTIVNLVSSQVNPIIIGNTTLRDDIILFTTSNIQQNPGGHDTSSTATSTSAGQLWRLSYDPVTFAPTLVLLYNNFIDFTTYHPIPPSAAEGRYESSAIQRVYWTDNFNELRSFNTKNPQGFSIDPSLLDSRPNLDLSVAILQKINDSGGTTKVGIYQTAYRLKNTGGATTIYSKTSNMVPIMIDPSTNPFRDLKASAPSSSVTKTITWKIDGLDTDYDRLEIVILFREHKDDIPTIDQVFDEPVPSNGSFTFTYTGKEPTTPVDLNDFLNVNSAFTHCKTIVSKTNQLLAGNVKNKTFDVDYDARAYRFNANANVAPGVYTSLPNARVAQINNSQGSSLFVNAYNVINNTGFTNSATWDIPETFDAINPDQNTQNLTGFRFQSDGQTIGGQGPNIKYTFKTLFFSGDTVNGFSPTNLDSTVGPIGFNSRFTYNSATNYTLNNNTFLNNNFYDSFKSWYISSAFRGYQHDEVYAFVIRFYDKKGRPGFAKWIGDIKMPIIFENQGILGGTKAFPISKLSFVEEIGILVPEFTVTIPQNILDKISGWDIEVCERTTNDKTIMAAGSLHSVSYDSFGNRFHSSIIGDLNLRDLGAPYVNYTAAYGATPSGAGPDIVDGHKVMFRSPEFTFGTFPGWQANDSIKILCGLQNNYRAESTNPAVLNEISLRKNYVCLEFQDSFSTTPGSYIERTMITNGAQFINRGGTSAVTAAGVPIRNNTDETIVASKGEAGVFLEFLNANLYPNLTKNPISLPLVMPFGRYYAVYKRQVTNQYGGNTYSQRSDRKYISTGHFQPITLANHTQTSFTVDITGGDIYTDIWDIQTNLKNWGGPAGDFRAVVYWLPVQSVINTEWRYGNFVNRNGLLNNGTSVDLGEDFFHNPVFSAVDNIKPAYVKPAQFTDVQEYDNRVFISQVKINGELTDSWGIFLPNDYRDVEGNSGPITALLSFKDNIFVIQNNGTAILPVNPNTLIPDNSSSTLVLGTGEGIQKPVYITTTEGSRHQWSCITSDSGIYFFDAKSKLIYKLRGHAEPLIVTEGLFSYFINNIQGDLLKTDNPIYEDLSLGLQRAGISATYDYQNYDALFTFHDVQNSVKSHFTVAHSEVINAFTSFYDFFPTCYINNKRLLSTTEDGNIVHLQDEGNPGEFFGVVYPSEISFLVNPYASVRKVFDNIEIESEVRDLNGIDIKDETWSKILINNDYQSSGVTTLIPGVNIKRKERIWNLTTSRNLINPSLINPDILNPSNILTAQLFPERIRNYVSQITLSFDNNINGNFRKIICPLVKTHYRISQR